MTNPPENQRPVRESTTDPGGGDDDGHADPLSPADRLALALGTVPVPSEDVGTP